MGEKKLRDELAALGQRLGTWVALQSLTEGQGAVYRLRAVPMSHGSVTVEPVRSRAKSNVVMTVTFEDGTCVVIGAESFTRLLTVCILRGRPCTFEHGEWQENLDADHVSFSFPSTELKDFQQAFEAHVAKHAQKE